VHEPSGASSISGARPGIQVSRDGYIRLSPVTFRQIPLIHLISGMDEEPAAGPRTGGAQLSEIMGYTEWVSTEKPAITIGWDWRLSASKGAASCLRFGEVRSNVMLMDDQGRDLGPQRSAELLGAELDGINWSDQVLQAVSSRY
jgi:hypothetical protein